jgi:cell division septum initiation protein DivIVA
MEDSRLLTAARLTPDDAARTLFRKVMFGGLDEGEVEAFRHRVVDELRLLDHELDQVQAECAELALQARTAPAPVPAPAPVAESVELQGVHILSRAQENADRIIKDAQAFGRQAADDAQRQRAEILDEARRKASELAETARAEAASLVKNALEDATRQAADIVSKAPIDAQSRVVMMQSLGASLEIQLRAFAASLVTALDEWDRQRQRSMAEMTGGNGHAPADLQRIRDLEAAAAAAADVGRSSRARPEANHTPDAPDATD